MNSKEWEQVYKSVNGDPRAYTRFVIGGLKGYDKRVRDDTRVRDIADVDTALSVFVSERIKTLNVAGNRESRNPGIHRAVFRFIVDSFV